MHGTQPQDSRLSPAPVPQLSAPGIVRGRTFTCDALGQPTINLPPRLTKRGLRRTGDQHYDPELQRKLVANYQKSVEQIENLFLALREIDSADHDQLAGMAEDSIQHLQQDSDLFLSLGIAPGGDKYPARHSVQTSMLAMSVAAHQGLQKDALVSLGVGCLAHDAGMLHIDRALFETTQRLDPIAFLEVTRHPTITFDLMARIDHLAGTSRLVAYQMHERCDGTGYPRRRTTRQIHPLSRIATVADVFVAMISPRPHRPGLMPYFAMEHLLREANRGIFDADAVRALLQTVSLFPLGSYVELSDGRVGKVLRSNGPLYTRPVVHAWNRSCLEMPPDIVNLAEANDVSIVRPLPDLQALSAEVAADNWE